MNSTTTSDVSLYELVLNTNPAVTALQVSPTTLKAMSDALVNLLIEQEISALVWAKLPRAEAWWDGLRRYASLGLAKGAYFFGVQRDETDEIDGHNTPNGTVTSGDANRLGAAAAIASVQLLPESLFRREYFLIIWSEQFKGALFAHRPRSAQTVKSPEFASHLDSPGTYGHTPHLIEAIPDRKQLLLAIQTFDVPTVEQTLVRLGNAIAAEPAITVTLPCANDTPAPTARMLTEQWAKLQHALGSAPSSLPTLETLFTKHLQHQEDLWHRSTAYRKQAEQVDVLQQQKAELSNTIHLKDEFLNTVGQELRTPLTTIKTALSLLSSPNLKPPQRQKYMDLIAKECDRQSSLITSLLDLVQLEQPSEQAVLPPIRLVEVVPGVVSTYQPVAEEKGIRLSYTIPEDLPPVACMTNWIKQIVINLLHNGIKYTPSGGQVFVRAKQQGDYVQLEVRDTGIGIVQTEIPKIFDRFYRIRQAADESSGAGLGLSIVQQLLLHCGGSISVKSKVGEGSVFNVLLPLYKPNADLGE